METVHHDDDVLSMFSFGEQEEVRGVGESETGVFKEEAVSAQRFVVQRLLKSHVKGRMEIPTVFPDKMVPERLFNVSKLFMWDEGEPLQVVNALREGRVRVRLQAAMGVGKSTRLAPIIARELDYRVLVVSVDAHCLQQTGVYIKNSGIGQFRRNWSTEKGERVCVMTYADFNSHMAAPTRSYLYKCFDVVIFDEAFEPTADIFVAKRLFSAYATGEISLVLCSATMRSDFAEGDSESRLSGNFIEVGDLTVQDAIDSGKLVSKYLTDRTIVFAPFDSELLELHEHYVANGVDAKVLDSGASYEDLRDVISWLEGDSLTPRVVMASPSYGLGFNFPVSFAVIWPFQSHFEDVAGVWTEVRKPMTRQYLTQVKSRTGRGIADGSSGVVLGKDRSELVELYDHDKLAAYVKLSAANVKPRDVPFWDPCKSIFPHGLNSTTAQNLLRVCLPVEITARYLAEDGKFAKKYASALNLVAHPDHYLMPSQHENPIGHDSWKLVDAPVGDVGMPLTVPVNSNGELAILIFAVSALAEGLVQIERWRPVRVMAYGDGFESDAEETDSRFAPKRMQRRRIENPVYQPPQLTIPADVPSRWAYTGLMDQSQQMPRRAGMLFDKEKFEEAFLALEATLNDYKPPSVMPEVVDTAEGTVAVVESGIVESPGGSTVCTLDAKVCQKMNMGQVLEPGELLKVVGTVKDNLYAFVGSKLFSCYAGPWESILRTLTDTQTVVHITRVGAYTDVYAMINHMSKRFSSELIHVLAKSYVFKRKFARFFRRRPTTDKLMRAIKDGTFNQVAQTDAFIDRVKLLKGLLDRVLLTAEEANVYLPNMITSAQRGLPIQGHAPLGVYGRELTLQPRGIQSVLDDGYQTDLSDRFNRGKRPKYVIDW